MQIGLSGFFSGIDVNGIIEQTTLLNRVPIVRLEDEILELDNERESLNSVASSIGNLRSKLSALNDFDLFNSKAVSNSNTSLGVASISSESTAPINSTTLVINQLATSSNLKGSKFSSIPAGTENISTVFGQGALGSFSVNGQNITIDDTAGGANPTTLNEVATAIQSALTTAGATAPTVSYNAVTGRFEINGDNLTPVLSSGTSDFLQEAQLFNNGTATITSLNPVGRADPTSSLNSLKPGISGSNILINGVAVTINTTSSLEGILADITGSDAGVVATYDSYTDQIVLTAKERGALAVTVAEGDGNIAAQLGLTTGTLSVGNATQFTINGETRFSQDATLDQDELGIDGLTFTATATGTTTLTVGTDTDKIADAIDDFLTAQNELQQLLDVETRLVIDGNLISGSAPENPNADSDGDGITDGNESGPLSGNTAFSSLALDVRSLISSSLAGTFTDGITLFNLGIDTNSENNSFSLVDRDKLKELLESDADLVEELFQGSTGLFSKLDPRLDAYENDIGNSIIDTRLDAIDEEQRRLLDEISAVEARAAAEESLLRAQFALLDQASADAQSTTNFLSSLNSNNQ